MKFKKCSVGYRVHTTITSVYIVMTSGVLWNKQLYSIIFKYSWLSFLGNFNNQ